MLVRFTDTKGRVVWINPVHVRSLAPKKPDITSVYVSVSTSGFPINVTGPIDEVADMLNAAMPMDPYAGALDDDTPPTGPGFTAIAPIV